MTALIAALIGAWVTLAVAEPALPAPAVAAATAAVQARMGAAAEVSLTLVKTTSPLDATYHDAVLAAGAELGRPVRVFFRAASAGVPVTVADATVVLQVAVPHAHAAHALRRGQPLTAADVVTAHHLLADGPLRPRPTADDAVGGRVLRAVPAGACLTSAMLGTAPLVARGARVAAVVRDGPIEVRAEMIAVEHGGRGDLIRVKNPETQREVRARVLERDLVEIRYDR